MVTRCSSVNLNYRCLTEPLKTRLKRCIFGEVSYSRKVNVEKNA